MALPISPPIASCAGIVPTALRSSCCAASVAAIPKGPTTGSEDGHLTMPDVCSDGGSIALSGGTAGCTKAAPLIAFSTCEAREPTVVDVERLDFPSRAGHDGTRTAPSSSSAGGTIANTAHRVRSHLVREMLPMKPWGRHPNPPSGRMEGKRNASEAGS